MLLVGGPASGKEVALKEGTHTYYVSAPPTDLPFVTPEELAGNYCIRMESVHHRYFRRTLTVNMGDGIVKSREVMAHESLDSEAALMELMYLLVHRWFRYEL